MGKVAPSPVLGKVSGEYFGVVVASGRNGLVMRRAARYKRAQSPLQKEAADRMAQASALWPDMDNHLVEAWNEYAQTLHRRDRLTGQVYSPTGFNAFTGLACKVLQVDPSAQIPVDPPVGVFSGDSLRITVDVSGKPSPTTPSPVAHSSKAGGATGVSSPFAAVRAERKRGPDLHPLAPSSCARTITQGGGTVRWTSDGPNTSGTVTELLWEKLANKNRKPSGRMRTAGFHAFAVGSLSVDVEAEPGWYQVGYRYVEKSTGRVTGWWIVGKVEVS